MKVRKFLVIFLAFLMVLGPGLGDLAAQVQEKKTREEKQVPPKPGEGKEIYVPGFTPFLWVNHGGDPYFPCLERASLLAGLIKVGRDRLVSDLAEQGFTEAQAQYIWTALLTADSPEESRVTETVLSVDTPLERMRFGHGVVRMVIVKGQAEPAWQLILPPELGSEVVYLPKVCCNVSVSPFKAQTEKSELVIRTEVKERERVVTVPEYRDRIVYRDREVLKATPRPDTTTKDKEKNNKGLIAGILTGVGVAVLIGVAKAMGGGGKPGGGKIDPGGCGKPGFPPCP